jgi:hypothetical protein
MKEITLTTKQFDDAVQKCIDVFIETAPKDINEDTQALFRTLIEGWCVGLKLELFITKEE